jgi:hypothetical protein
MKVTGSSTYGLTYKRLTCCIVLAFAYYWLVTFGLVLFGTKVTAHTPNQTFIYRSFARQNWRMFAITKVYNRQMLFITRNAADHSKTDTTDLVQYLLSEKREYAPFNNEQDAHERILYIVMNGVEARVHYYEKKIKDTMPGKPADFYQQRAIQIVEADATHQQDINNITGFAKYILQQKKAAITGKEYQLIIKHKYIQPAKPPIPAAQGSDEQIRFISNYKPL